MASVRPLGNTKLEVKRLKTMQLLYLIDTEGKSGFPMPNAGTLFGSL
jgi:hypothetical protein